jgi:CRP-like cAMP-binding protein
MLRIAINNGQDTSAPSGSRTRKAARSPNQAKVAPRPRFDEALVRLGLTLKLDRWDVLFREGEAALFVYRVEEGALRLFDGRGATIAVIEPSEYCLCNMGDVYSLSCSAVLRTEVTRIPRHRFLRLAQQDGSAQKALRKAARQELKAWPTITTVNGAAARLKIATFLLHLYDELLSELCDEGSAADRIGDLTLPRMLNVVAAGLEISTSAARRGLAILQHQGAVQLLHASKPANLDIAALQRLATGLAASVHLRAAESAAPRHCAVLACDVPLRRQPLEGNSAH